MPDAPPVRTASRRAARKRLTTARSRSGIAANAYPDSARRAIEVFNLLNIRPTRALLLAIAAKFASNETAPAFQFLVALGVRFLIAGSTRSGSVELPLAAASHEVFSEEIVTTARLIERLAGITPSDEEFRVAFESARVTKQQLARYYLRSLEMAAKNEPEPWFVPTADRAVINLEHVLPKKPEGNWPQFTNDEVNLYVSRLGNQALMRASENSDLRSAEFADKKAVYADSPYVLTSQIADLDDWSVATISARQQTLAGLALTAWPV